MPMIVNSGHPLHERRAEEWRHPTESDGTVASTARAPAATRAPAELPPSAPRSTRVTVRAAALALRALPMVAVGGCTSELLYPDLAGSEPSIADSRILPDGYAIGPYQPDPPGTVSITDVYAAAYRSKQRMLREQAAMARWTLPPHMPNSYPTMYASPASRPPYATAGHAPFAQVEGPPADTTPADPFAEPHPYEGDEGFCPQRNDDHPYPCPGDLNFD